MCQCTPSIRTPFCGKGSCQWPDKKTQGSTEKCESCKNGYNGENGNGYQPCSCPKK